MNQIPKAKRTKAIINAMSFIDQNFKWDKSSSGPRSSIVDPDMICPTVKIKVSQRQPMHRLR
jgi:hypothetical protein